MPVRGASRFRVLTLTFPKKPPCTRSSGKSWSKTWMFPVLWSSITFTQVRIVRSPQPVVSTVAARSERPSRALRGCRERIEDLPMFRGNAAGLFYTEDVGKGRKKKIQFSKGGKPDP